MPKKLVLRLGIKKRFWMRLDDLFCIGNEVGNQSTWVIAGLTRNLVFVVMLRQVRHGGDTFCAHC
jgi:hypothetical protein